MVNKRIVMILTKDILYPYLDVRVYKEAKTLVKNGYDVTVVCRVYSLNNLKSEEEYEDIKIIRELCYLPEKKTLSRLERLYYNFKNVNQVSKKVCSLNPILIHAHDLNALLEGVLAKRKLKVPLIYDSHEDWPRMEQSKGNNLQFISAFIYEYLLLFWVDQVITVNDFLAQKFLNRKSVDIILNLPEITGFRKNPDKINAIIEEYNLQGKIVLEYHGVIGIGRNKGLDVLIYVTKNLIKKFKDLRFLVIGPDFERFLNLIHTHGLDEYIVFTGPVPFYDIPNYISVADISYAMIPPTTQYIHSTPTKLFESLLFGKPTIVNKEFPEVVKIFEPEINKFGDILVYYDVEKITFAIEKLLNNTKLRTQIGKNAEKLIKSKYSWEAQESKLLEIYENLLR